MSGFVDIFWGRMGSSSSTEKMRMIEWPSCQYLLASNVRCFLGKYLHSWTSTKRSLLQIKIVDPSTSNALVLQLLHHGNWRPFLKKQQTCILCFSKMGIYSCFCSENRSLFNFNWSIFRQHLLTNPGIKIGNLEKTAKTVHFSVFEPCAMYF